MKRNPLATRRPTMRRHPLTGEPIKPLGVVGNRVVWPIMGGAPDDDPPPSDPPPADAPAADPANADADDKGFPANTPVAEMTPQQRDAYNAHMRERNRETARQWRAVTGERTPQQLADDLAELDRLRTASLTDSERAIEDAKRQAREETTREYGPRSVRAAFDLLLGDMPEQERNDEIDLLDLSKFLKQNGDVDTAKVRQFAQKIAPPVKDEGTQRRNYGQGSHTRGQSSGVAAGAEMYAAGRKKSTTNS